MRIISGRFKGAKLMTPPGDTTRPTADRTREALFNLLSHGRYRSLLKDAHVVDVCAGSGSVGLEALSRSASHATFIEMDRTAQGVLKTNIAKCRMEGQSKILAIDARKIAPAGTPCDLVFIDPPYHRELAESCLAAIRNQGWLAEDGLVVVQVHPGESFTPPEDMTVVNERKYGAARLFLLSESGDD